MLTYNKIIYKLINFDNNIFCLNYDDSDKIHGMLKIFFKILCSDVNCKKRKFDKLDEIMNNFYFSTNFEKKSDFFNLFCKIQKIYHTLNNLIIKYKYKKSKIIINTDLQLNEINIDSPNVICIYHINSKYLFRIEDLLKIIYTSLTNGFSFFCEPLPIKNPYNNVPFGKSILYYIYFFVVSNTKMNNIKSSHFDVFLKFKECNFNMTRFVNKYDYLLREYNIENYINNCSKENLKDIINKIINDFNYRFKNVRKHINIADDFPENDLIKIFKPYIQLKLIASYSLLKNKKQEAEKKLNKKLREFQEYNPQFGRKFIRFKNIIKNGKIKKIKSHVEFIVKHKKFNNCEIENFMSNHLSYKYDYTNNDESHESDESDESDYDDQPSEIFLISEILINNRRTLNTTTTIPYRLNTNYYQYNNEQYEEEQDEDEEQEEYGHEEQEEYGDEEQEEYEDEEQDSII